MDKRSQRPIAILRDVPGTYADCLVHEPPSEPIDVVLAREQHQAYAAALARAGFDIRRLPADERFPDCCFIEDTAVLLDDLGILTRPGAPSRRGEVEAVLGSVAAILPVVRLQAPATLDGGDVLRVGDRLFVGASARTNAAGRARLAELAGERALEVVTVELGDTLHLKSAVTALDDETVLLVDGLVDRKPFRDLRILETPGHEDAAANVLRLPGRQRVLIQKGFPATRGLLTASGYHVVDVDISEFAKGDAALTCLSLLKW